MSADLKSTQAKWIAVAVLAVSAIAFIATNMADKSIYDSVSSEGVYEKDWGRALRTVGFLPLWLLIGLGIGFIDGERERGTSIGNMCRRGSFIAVSAVAAGLAAEVLKLLIRRERPEAQDGVHVFRAWAEEWWSTSGLGLPSSHTVVAFAGAVAMSILFPRTTVIWVAVAAGCGWTRVLNRDHFASDVVLGAFVGAAVAWLLWRYVFQPGRDPLQS